MEAESFWLGCWSETFSPTFLSLIVGTKQKATSQENISATNQARMPTTVQKENHCIIEVRSAIARVISIARRKRNAKAVHKRNCAPQAHIGDCSFIGRSRRDKRFARWQERQSTSSPRELATRSRPCSPSSNNRSSCA